MNLHINLKIPELSVVVGKLDAFGLIQIINATEARLGQFLGDGKYGSGREERNSKAESREAFGYVCGSGIV